MKITARSLAVGLVGVCLVSTSYAFSRSRQSIDDSTARPRDRHDQFVTTTRAHGIDCILPTLGRDGPVLDRRAAARNRLLVQLGNLGHGRRDLRIHQSVFVGVLSLGDGGRATRTGPGNVYSRFAGDEITSANDGVVANFESNVLLRTEHLDPATETTRPRFTGYKALVGTRVARDERGRQTDVDTYIRIIIDWGGVGYEAQALPVYRAAYVISQQTIPAAQGTRSERHYRFLPGGAPFRMLACIPTAFRGHSRS